MERTDGPPAPAAGGRRQRKNTPLTKGEKWLLFASLLLVSLIGGYSLWSYVIDLDPEVSIPPAPPLPIPNAYDTYVSASKLIVTDIKFGNGTNVGTLYVNNLSSRVYGRTTVKPPWHWPKGVSPRLADMQALMAKNAPVFPVINQGLNSQYRTPAVRPSRSYTSDQGLDDIAELLKVAGNVKSLSGDWQGATERYLQAIQLGGEIPRGGPIRFASCGIGSQRQGRDGLWPILGKLSETEASLAAHRMEMIASRQVPLVDILQEEKWTQQDSLLELFRQTGWRKYFISDMRGYGSQRLMLFFISDRTIMLNYTRYIDAAMTQAKQQYTVVKKGSPQTGDCLSQYYADETEHFRVRYTCNFTMNTLLTVSFALRAYYCDHSKYPATLDELVPKYLQRIPNDPFAVKRPLRYHRLGRSYALYSIGPDGIDDKGRACMSRDQIYPSRKWVVGPMRPGLITLTTTGDIVAGTNRP